MGQILKNKDHLVRYLSQVMPSHSSHLRREYSLPGTEKGATSPSLDNINDNWIQLKILRLVHPSKVPIAGFMVLVLPYQDL